MTQGRLRTTPGIVLYTGQRAHDTVQVRMTLGSVHDTGQVAYDTGQCA